MDRNESLDELIKGIISEHSYYIVNLLEPFKDYLQEFHPAEFEVYQSMDSMLSYLRKSAEERKAAN